LTDTAAAVVTIVVANPDPTVCEVLARVVEAAGYEAVRVTDPAMVPGAVLSAPADAVVLDLGPSTADQLKALRAGDHPRSTSARAIVISTGPANALLAWQCDADAVLTRPFPAAQLQESLAAALERGDADRAAMRAAQVRALSS
jgi:DNA-binding response OmpR family regulator